MSNALEEIYLEHMPLCGVSRKIKRAGPLHTEHALNEEPSQESSHGETLFPDSETRGIKLHLALKAQRLGPMDRL